MKINQDLSLPIVVNVEELQWSPSPIPGVDRKMLYRVGREVARATSIVRYAPGSSFPAHRHPGGEEIIVIEGVFGDETGEYPAGSYIRNPPGSSHSPRTTEGCIILVKLRQFAKRDSAQYRFIPSTTEQFETQSSFQLQELFKNGEERVSKIAVSPNQLHTVANSVGLEILVLEGSLIFNGQNLEAMTWIRLPTKTNFDFLAGDTGASLWVKSAPLLQAEVVTL